MVKCNRLHGAIMGTVNIRDVAHATGLAKSSVSRILNNTPGYTYDAVTQQKVRDAAEKLGYQANTAARLLKQQRKNLIGLTANFTERPYVGRLLTAVRDELQRVGYEPVLIEPAHMVASYDKAPFPSLELLAGVLSFGFFIDEHQAQYFLGLRRRLPVVALYPINSTDVDWIYTDSARGVEMLVDHLVGLGHQSMAFADASESPYHSDHLKSRGWKRALRKHRLKASLLKTIDLDWNATVQERAAYLEEALLKSTPRPTAVLCSGDESALCLIGRLQARGWKIPQDLSVTGYDGIAFGEYSHPQLTTIRQPVAEIARGGVSRLLEIIEQGHDEIIPRQQRIEPELVVRGSTARISTRRHGA